MSKVYAKWWAARRAEVLFFLALKDIYRSQPASVRKGIDEMEAIYRNPNTAGSDADMAIDTIVEAMFPGDAIDLEALDELATEPNPEWLSDTGFSDYEAK